MCGRGSMSPSALKSIKLNLTSSWKCLTPFIACLFPSCKRAFLPSKEWKPWGLNPQPPVQCRRRRWIEALYCSAMLAQTLFFHGKVCRIFFCHLGPPNRFHHPKDQHNLFTVKTFITAIHIIASILGHQHSQTSNIDMQGKAPRFWLP